MDMQAVHDRGLVLLGCGKMGSAMLAGWLNDGLPASSVWVQDPNPSEWLRGLDGLNLNVDLPEAPAILLIAVKPQMMGDAVPNLGSYGGGDTVVLSIAAGTAIGYFESVFGAATPVIRAMPNTPAAIGRGVTALIANRRGADSLSVAEELLRAVGQTVRLDSEEQMDAVTAVSGSGPAYVFHLIESLARAGEAQGLDPELALKLAKATVGGAGQLAEDSDEDPGQLRKNVTSPNGTTQAGLEVLMDEETGLPPLMHRTVAAAADRSRELKG
ncbi:pyrroline-5-carboxylate reductase [Tranquillimonas rosea]|uniref:pyrroline-5-carboxylate reductase n=1 Tax=Tranquillimonas rosea TaxID=641238 RepID=UPI003BABA255